MELLDKFSGMSPSPTKLRVLIATLIFLTVPFFVYYTFYVRNQTTYFTNRDLRLLARRSSQIATKVESVSSVFKNAADKFIQSKENESATGTTTHYRSQEDHRVNRDEFSKNLKGLMQKGEQLLITDFESTNRDPIKDNPGNRSTITLEFKHNSAVSLFLEYVYKVDDQRGIKITAQTDLNSLLLPLLSNRTTESSYDTSAADEFVNILIAEAASNGKVIFQQDSSEFHVISLDKLTTADNGSHLDFSTLDKTSGVRDIQLADSKFKLFFHPITLSVPQTGAAPGKETNWIVCGLVPADQFRKQVWAISYTVLIGFGFLPVLVILAWPFLKLMLIGPKDRLRTADIYFLAFSILIGLSLLTSVGLYLYSYAHLENEMDRQLEDLSKRVSKNFETELRACLDQLETLNTDEGVQKDLQFVKEASTRNEGKTEVFGMLSKPQSYPYFDTAVWIDSQGNQRLKWTNNKYGTQFISVASRPYVSNLNEGRYRYFNRKKFWLEPILSRTTGRNEIEISQMLSDNSGWISAFDARLMSLMQPVLPVGYGFSIIDSEGKVLFHSDEARHLGENFFQECDYDRYLLSAVLNRTRTPLDVQYLGSGHRLYTAPVDGFPNWSLIVFRDKQVLRTTFVEILSLSILVFLAYALILLIALCFFYLLNINLQARRAWLWPSRERTLSYLISVVVILILSGLSLILIASIGGLLSAILTCFLSFIGIAFHLINLRFMPKVLILISLKNYRLWPRTSSLRRRIDRPELAYALNLSVLLLLTAIIPSFAIFKFAYESEMTLFIRQGQVAIANGLAERDERVRNQYENPNTSSRSDDFVNQRLGRSWDVYAEFFFGTERKEINSHPVAEEQPEPRPSSLHRFIHNVTPRLKNSVVKLALFDSPFVDGSRAWLGPLQRPTRLTLHADIGRPGQIKSNHLETLVPSFELPRVAWFLFLAAFFPFYLSFYLIVKKVFLIGLHRPSSSSLQRWLTRQMRGNCFVILDGPFTQKKALNARFHIIDLKGLADQPNWVQEFNYHDLPQKKIIAIDHFEYKLDNPEVNRQKTVFLENLLASWRVMVISAADPTRYRFGDDAQSGQQGADRWAGVICHFVKVYAEDNGSHPIFLSSIDAKKKEALSQTNNDHRPQKEIADLFEALKAECKPRLPLQQIGLGILRQPEFFDLTREHLINRVGNQAQTYYYNIWNSCSNGERLTLLHLAKDRLLSAKDPDIGPLLRRGLVVRDPDLHLMNESFRRFVRAESEAQVIAEYEKAEEASPWHNLKVPLLVALLSVVVFLFVTQRDIYNSWLAALTALITVIPAVFKLLSFFQKDSVNSLPHEAS